MRISDWSSDVCSSDLIAVSFGLPGCSVQARPEVISFVAAMSSQARAADARAGDESGPVMVADRYRIHPDQPLPALDAAGGLRALDTTDEAGPPNALRSETRRAGTRWVETCTTR